MVKTHAQSFSTHLYRCCIQHIPHNVRITHTNTHRTQHSDHIHFQFAEFSAQNRKTKHTHHKQFHLPFTHSFASCVCLFSLNSHTRKINKSIEPNILHNVNQAFVWFTMAKMKKQVRFSFALISSQGNFNALPIFTVSTHIICSHIYTKPYLIWLFTEFTVPQTTSQKKQQRRTQAENFSQE